VTGAGDLTLEKLAAGVEELGGFLHQVALQTQHLKIIVLEQLAILAAQIAYLITVIPWTFGANAAGITALQILGKKLAMAMVRQLLLGPALHLPGLGDVVKGTTHEYLADGVSGVELEFLLSARSLADRLHKQRLLRGLLT
jgi:hypothetical protein